MGAETFVSYGYGCSPEDAFKKLRENVARDVGWGGYSGTIVEKDSFVIIDCPPDKDPEKYAYELIKENDPRISSKWGPAGCIVIRPAKEADVKTQKITDEKDMPPFKPVYVVYGGDTAVGMYPTLGSAIHEAETYTKTHLVPTEIRKEMVSPQNVLYAVLPKGREECLGEYLFFGWASA